MQQYQEPRLMFSRALIPQYGLGFEVLLSYLVSCNSLVVRFLTFGEKQFD